MQGGGRQAAAHRAVVRVVGAVLGDLRLAARVEQVERRLRRLADEVVAEPRPDAARPGHRNPALLPDDDIAALPAHELRRGARNRRDHRGRALGEDLAADGLADAAVDEAARDRAAAASERGGGGRQPVLHGRIERAEHVDRHGHRVGLGDARIRAGHGLRALDAQRLAVGKQRRRGQGHPVPRIGAAAHGRPRRGERSSKENGAPSHGGSTAVRKRTFWFEMLGTERIVGPVGALVTGWRGRPIHTPICWLGRTLPATVALVLGRVLPRTRAARRVEAGLGELGACVGDLERSGARLAPLEGAHVPAHRLRHVLHESVGTGRVERPRRLERARPVPLDVVGLDRPRNNGVRRRGQGQQGSRCTEQQPGSRPPSSSHTPSVRRPTGGGEPNFRPGSARPPGRR